MTRPVAVAIALVAALFCGRPASAQVREVTVTIPAGVGFLVTDVSTSAPASTGPMQVSFGAAKKFKRTDSLVISIAAASSTFSGPGTTRIPASAVSWTASSANGTASSGTLSSAAYSQVYQSPTGPESGSVDVSWLLGAIAAPGLRAGTHALTVRWRLEVQ